jgi:GNAT superfamily N-acetyltransferase
VERDDGSFLLDLLYVIPTWQRRGVATALLSVVSNELFQLGIPTLGSRYLLGNEESRLWHQRFGFEEREDFMLARRYYHHYALELGRREKIGDLDNAEREALLSEIARWKSRVEAVD